MSTEQPTSTAADIPKQPSRIGNRLLREALNPAFGAAGLLTAAISAAWIAYDRRAAR